MATSSLPSGGSRGNGILAVVGLVVSIAAALLAFFSGLGTRWEWWDFRHGLGYFKDSFFAGGLGLLLCLAALVWALIARNKSGRMPALVGLILSLLFAGNFAIRINQARHVPPIHDITTDVKDPPAFSSVIPLRKASGALNPVEYGGPKVAEQQQKAYPDIQPLLLKMAPEKVWQHCLEVAQNKGWAIVSMDQPHGRIEATDTTFWFGFKDDIAIRVTPEKDGGSRVDVRSLSRVGGGDVGTNAKRIRGFLKQLNASVS